MEQEWAAYSFSGIVTTFIRSCRCVNVLECANLSVNLLKCVNLLECVYENSS